MGDRDVRAPAGEKVITYYVPVHGTWASEPRADAWWQPTSAFAAALSAKGCDAWRPEDPFRWSGDLNGWQIWRRWRWLRSILRTSATGDENDWRAGGDALRWYAVQASIANRNLIVHSHGLPVVLYACASGLTIRQLISIASPVRKDFLAVARLARPRIEQWLHLASTADEVQVLGEIGDGRIGAYRAHPYADRNLLMRGAEHSDVLRQPNAFPIEIDAIVRWLKE